MKFKILSFCFLLFSFGIQAQTYQNWTNSNAFITCNPGQYAVQDSFGVWVCIDTALAAQIYWSNEVGINLADTIRQSNTIRVPKSSFDPSVTLGTSPKPILSSSLTGTYIYASGSSPDSVAEHLLVGEDGTDFIIAKDGYFTMLGTPALAVNAEYWLSQTQAGAANPFKGSDSLCTQPLFQYLGFWDGEHWYESLLESAVCFDGDNLSNITISQTDNVNYSIDEIGDYRILRFEVLTTTDNDQAITFPVPFSASPNTWDVQISGRRNSGASFSVSLINGTLTATGMTINRSDGVNNTDNPYAIITVRGKK